MSDLAPVIETRLLRKIYRGAKFAAVESLDLSVATGQVFGFLGPNGAGKTTTIGMLLGNVFPTSGSATVLGKPIGDRNTRRSVGYLPEKFQFHEFLSATEFLDMHGQLYGMSVGDRRRRIPEVLEIVGLLSRAKDKLGAFSKGMQQRAGLAQAILHEPRLVILDEPTSALDPLGRRAVRDIVLYLKGRGTTVLLNSHLLSEIEMTCDTVAIIKRGQIVRQGTVDEITTPVSSVTIALEAITPAVLEAASRFGTVNPSAVTEDRSTSEDRLDSLSDVSEITVRLSGGTVAKTPYLVASLVSAGARVRSVVPVRESLEDAFVRVMAEGDAA
ncbi:MAG: ABC transporter ATP-binding protein [Akkermansiaceae bacterium]|nr:ABC transporter ATP-binding protein [Armatimonadota bacterium]